MRSKSCFKDCVHQSKSSMGGWMGEWMDGWMGVKSILRIAYSNQKLPVSATVTSDILSEADSTRANLKSFRTWIGPAEMTRSPCFHSTMESPEKKIGTFLNWLLFFFLQSYFLLSLLPSPSSLQCWSSSVWRDSCWVEL